VFELLQETLGRLAARPKSVEESSGDCPKGPKGDRCRKRRAKQRRRRMYRYGAFAPVFYNNTGTPRSSALKGDTGGGAPMPGSADGGGGEMTASKDDVMGRLAQVLGLVEFGGSNHSFGGSGVTWGGYQVPNPLAVTTRKGGPVIGGPGFKSDPGPIGGVIDPKRSPGLGFRSESAWKVWRSALVVMDKDKVIPKNQVFMAALQRAGVRVNDLDPAESRLIEMGIEWYLSDPGSTSAQRGGGGAGTAGGGGDVSGADKYMGGAGAP
jgi:hypothetical protein